MGDNEQCLGTVHRLGKECTSEMEGCRGCYVACMSIRIKRVHIAAKQIRKQETLMSDSTMELAEAS